MRCKICNDMLTNSEAVRKDMHGHFMDTCRVCSSVINDTLGEENACDDRLDVDNDD